MSIEKLRSCFKFIRTVVAMSPYERVAFNVELRTLKERMLFKTVLEEYFEKISFNIVLFNLNVITIEDEEEKKEILKLYHDSLIGGHVGSDRMYKTKYVTRNKRLRFSMRNMRKNKSDYNHKNTNANYINGRFIIRSHIYRLCWSFT